MALRLTDRRGWGSWVADDPFGPYRFSTNEFLVGDPVGLLHSGKLTRRPGGELRFLAWRNYATVGSFVGELADPLPVAVDADRGPRVEGAGAD
jgi:beta-fructofuranosidase